MNCGAGTPTARPRAVLLPAVLLAVAAAFILLPGDASAWLEPYPSATAAVTERGALISLYEAAGGANWTRSDNWLSDKPLESWYGVTTDAGGRVTSLDLVSNELTGPIPDLSALANLQWLTLGDNLLQSMAGFGTRILISSDRFESGKGPLWFEAKVRDVGRCDVLIHEYAHLIHFEIRDRPGGREFDARLLAAYNAALDANLYDNQYASTNMLEYWAEMVEFWFQGRIPGATCRWRITTRWALGWLRTCSAPPPRPPTASLHSGLTF